MHYNNVGKVKIFYKNLCPLKFFICRQYNVNMFFLRKKDTIFN